MFMNFFKQTVTSLKVWAEMIKLEHTIFSAPFMLSAIILAKPGSWPSWIVLFWCAVALLGARSSAMTLNRLIDAKIDALNPRTANRAIPAGIFSVNKAILLSILGFALLLLAALNLPRICVQLLPVAVFFLTAYSYIKRFSYWCHLVLGIAVGGAVLGGWLAITGGFAWPPMLLGLAVAFWVCGFDILYALQDLRFDQENFLHSVPAKFGQKKAMRISVICHLLSVLFFCCAAYSFWEFHSSSVQLFWYSPISLGYGFGLLVIILGLIQQHQIINKDLTKINKVFFNANALISSCFFLCIFVANIFQSLKHLH
jgi:4-hydroxybenzoate polyprenyltransferase